MKLYVYDHCPFCVRSRMIMGLKNVEYEIIYLPNNDEATPIGLIGKKMLPILVTKNNQAIGESLDIVKYIDEKYDSHILTEPNNTAIDAWMEEITTSIYQLAVPRWAQSIFEEFCSEDARRYFINKKELVFGDLEDLIDKSNPIVAEINSKLAGLDLLITPLDPSKSKYSLTDICLFPLLRSLSIVKGIDWPPKVDTWLKEMAIASKINLNHSMAI